MVFLNLQSFLNKKISFKRIFILSKTLYIYIQKPNGFTFKKSQTSNDNHHIDYPASEKMHFIKIHGYNFSSYISTL